MNGVTSQIGFLKRKEVSSNLYQQAILANSPFAYFPMQESSGNITSIVGAGLGTVVGTPIYQANTPYGTKKSIQCGISGGAYTNLFNLTNVSFSGGQQSWSCIFQNRGSTVGYRRIIEVGGVSLSISNSQLQYFASGGVQLAYNLAINTWYRLVVTNDNGATKLYLNGVLVNSGTTTISNGIGNYIGWGLPLNIAHVALFNKVLSISEIQTIDSNILL